MAVFLLLIFYGYEQNEVQQFYSEKVFLIYQSVYHIVSQY